ncbi:prolyl oligopeptidase family serine peptidase [Chryseobacterium sp.]|uniref:carboxylesterase family protein n=1 Tax=Chryseobacterium sp. TaxID=1871047 RepID=UPI001B09A4DA|nr:prolyl oligopeptidase family serine peptidase [Chryseobacterium sp.]MBO9692926.1 prolyl oligopeptidase family serine peptidase [Chryseobacterium sp.]
MKKKVKILGLLLFIVQIAYGQSIKSDKIIFLNFTPVIDGKLDNKLRNHKKKKFLHFFQFDNPAIGRTDISYILGYTTTHLYLYIETKADSITHRDRGFINGDGFKLLLGKQQQGSSTNEYYDIAFSPSKDRNYWARKRIWEYNRDQNHGKQLSTKTEFEENFHDGKCGFEVLLAWDDIEPYHWSLKQLGYNLYFAKAISDNAAHGYSVIADEGIWDEEIPKRNYIPIIFEKPQNISNTFISAKLFKRNIRVGDLLKLNIISVSKKEVHKKIEIIIQNDASVVLLDKKLNHKIKKNLHNKIIIVDSQNLEPNHYNLIIRSPNETIAQHDFIVLPKFDFETLHSQILNNYHNLELGTVNTLLFKINTIEQNFNKLKMYETGKKQLDEYLQFKAEFEQFLKGNEPYKGIKGPYRRAFRSKYDGTYQPYSIKLPEHYDPAKKYPLLVFLHGSGQDDQSLLKMARSGGEFIEIAPFARDMYNCYDSFNSQNDILEAIDDAALHFSINKDKIIIGGFSMGAYGALRTYYEHPEMYKGVAIFAGHPDLANEWLGIGHPDFLNDKFLKNFSKTPIFIYHGRKDGALPVSKTEEFISKLKLNGIFVTARIIDDKAHEYPDKDTNEIYFDWLIKVIGN